MNLFPCHPGKGEAVGTRLGSEVPKGWDGDGDGDGERSRWQRQHEVIFGGDETSCGSFSQIVY